MPILQICNLLGYMLQEIYYYVGTGDLIRRDDRTSESTAVTIVDKGNQEVVEALTTGDGPLVSGLQPEVQAASEAGQKALLEALGSEKAEAKKAKKEKKEKTEKAEPTTMEESNAQTDQRDE